MKTSGSQVEVHPFLWYIERSASESNTVKYEAQSIFCPVLLFIKTNLTFCSFTPFYAVSVKESGCRANADTAHKAPKYVVLRHRRRKIMRYRILFVCHGNICRSVSAQYIFQDLVNRRGLASEFVIDSAATSDRKSTRLNSSHH